MATYNVNDLVLRVREKSDKTNSAHVSDAEIVKLLNEAYSRYYNALVTEYENYFISTSTFPMVVGTDNYNLPADLFKVSIVEMAQSNGNNFILKPFNLIDKNRTKNNLIATVTHYILLGDTIKLSPIPTTTETITIYYVPQPTALAAGGTVSLLAGADEYLVLEATVSVLMKEESDYSGYEMKAQQKMVDIMSVLAGRNSDIPMRVSDVETMNYNNYPFLVR